MPLIFKAEKVEEMRARYSKALEKLWIPTEHMKDRPGLHRENVFDFEDGLRLLISRDLFPLIGERIHVSASWESNAPDLKYIEYATEIIGKAYHTIGGKGSLTWMGQSPGKRIPHWIVVQEN